ncbi:hypothetical protein Dimus_032551 [Dionaea muscipula]
MAAGSSSSSSSSASSLSYLNIFFRGLRDSMYSSSSSSSSSSSPLNLYRHSVPLSMRSFDEVPAAAIPSTVSAAAIAADAEADFKGFLIFCNNPGEKLQLLANAWKKLSMEEKETYLQMASEVELQYQNMMAK